MSKFTITIKTDNAAFDDDYLIPELDRILTEKVLRNLGVAITRPGQTQSILDSNGNRVGSFKYHEELYQ